MTDYTRTVEITPSRNWVRTDPKKNYGITTCRIRFIVKGVKGAVQFMIGTGWASAPVRAHLSRFPVTTWDEKLRLSPEGWDLGYHSYVPMYEGQTEMDCEVLNGKCFYDGSTLNADPVVEGLLAGGTDWLWPKLEEYYRSVFEGGPYPDFSPQYLPHPDEVSK